MGGCGQVITASLTRTHDVGPCAGTGIVVGADQVTLNLNGHRVFGGGSAGTGQYAGILVSGRTGVAVTGGQVDHFSTGVAVINSTGTTVSNMTVSDNVGSYDQYAFADGILLEYSANNRIISNHVSRNGIYDNIGVLGVRSDHNLIQSNTTTDNFSVGLNSVGIGANIELNAFLDFGLPDRGASQVGNQVIHNTSLRAYRNGISDRANVREQIIGNTSTGSGAGDSVNGVGMGLQPLLASTQNLQGLIQETPSTATRTAASWRTASAAELSQTPQPGTGSTPSQTALTATTPTSPTTAVPNRHRVPTSGWRTPTAPLTVPAPPSPVTKSLRRPLAPRRQRHHPGRWRRMPHSGDL
ncbi:MAG: hypothetical protein M3083_13825 [Actinomycetota bacterium]|nr:hypothetical protein [Actinomycetota bacterium]